jgi:hypothetical protein
MAADSEQQGQVLPQMNDSTSTSELQRLPEEFWKLTLDDWRGSAAEDVQAELSDKKDFITNEEIGIGGFIQKLECTYC